jgi:hypothetical protein
MPRFSIRTLLVATAMTAMGVTALIAVRRWHDELAVHIAILMVAGAGALFGAAAFLPFRKPFMGAVVGAWLILAVMFLTAVVQVRY